MPKITRMFAFVVADKDENDEGVVGFRDFNGQWLPLVGADMARIQSLKPLADKISHETGKPYKIIPQELKFYQRLGLPLPGKSFMERHTDRLKRRNQRQLWQRACDHCMKSIETSFSPNRPEKVYCDACYVESIG